MADAVTPVAAVAVPAAPAVTPAAEPAPAPAAAAPSAATVAPVAPTVAADSIFPDVAPAAAAVPPKSEADMTPAAQAVVDAARIAADPSSGKAWVLQEGVLGVGEKPSWFKSDKYKNVAAQAEAYVALESRMGAFVGAPKDGKYEAPTLPENLNGVTIDMNAPLMGQFNTWAKENQLSQKGYNELLGWLAQDYANNQVSMPQIKAGLGEGADARLGAVSSWVKASLGDEGFQLLRTAGTGKQAVAVLSLVEKLMGKAVQPRMPKPGEDVSALQGAVTKQQLQAKQAEKNADGSPKYSAKDMLAEWKAYFDANPVKRDRQGQIRQ